MLSILLSKYPNCLELVVLFKCLCAMTDDFVLLLTLLYLDFCYNVVLFLSFYTFFNFVVINTKHLHLLKICVSFYHSQLTKSKS